MAAFAIVEAYNQATAHLTDAGCTLRHSFGSEFLRENLDTNSYVWVPTEFEKTGNARGGKIDEHDALCEGTVKVDIWCFGESHEVSWVMARNVLHALRAVVPAAAEKFASMEFEFPKDGEPMLGLGRALIVHYAIQYAILLDVYTPIARYVRSTAQSPTTPDPLTIQPTSAEITTSITTDDDVDGPEPIEDVVTP